MLQNHIQQRENGFQMTTGMEKTKRTTRDESDDHKLVNMTLVEFQNISTEVSEVKFKYNYVKTNPLLGLIKTNLKMTNE